MKCPSCSFENAPDARFCENCGQPLERVCPNCGQPVSPHAKFCKHCGVELAASTARPATVTQSETLDALRRAVPQVITNKILATRDQMEGERKLVTAIFTDIVGSTALAEQMDPEYWREIVVGAHQRVSEAVYRYEGTIAQLLGDGVLAFFGAPLAHEDDAERAIRAALNILAAIREYASELRRAGRVPDFQIRMGLNTGLVVVGNIGSDLHMEYLAIGDTVNLAARMQSAAEPGSILVSGNTHRLASSLFEFEDRGKIAVKGKAEPIQAYRVIGPKARPSRARGIEGLDSPLVGRDKETALLRNAINNLRQGNGQIVAVMGEAGLGKSRLVAEIRNWELGIEQQFKSDLQSSTVRIQWYEGRSLSYASSTPYAPFVDLLGNLFALPAEATDAEKYHRIKTQVVEWMPERAEETVPFIATLLGIPLVGQDAERVQYLEPPQVRGRIFQAVLNVFERLAERQPLVLAFEDLHWADSASLDLIEQLMALTDHAGLTILGLFRPQRQEPSWHFHEVAARDYAHRYTTITLEPLDDASSRALVANLLHIEDLPESVRSLILIKAEGNPFFVEEVIRSLLDAKLVVRENSHWRATREIVNIALPDTLAGVITARLDRLDEASKHAVQTASVIGREFQFDVLADVVEMKQALDEALGDLQRRELIRERSHSPRRTYLFKHALTQEAAYASILMSRRRHVHRRVAEHLEQVEPDRVNEIAWHLLEAHEAERALPYLVEAGDRAARAYSKPEAIASYARALETLQTIENLPLARRAYEGLGNVLVLSNDLQRAVENYHQMFHYAEARNDIPMQVSALNKLAFATMWLGQFPKIEKHLADAERLAREYQDRVGLAEMYWVRCGVCTMIADFGGAVKYLGESVQIGRELNLKEQLVFGLTHMANTLTFMTHFEEAWPTAQEALQLAEAIGNRRFQAEVLAFPIAFYHLRNGDLDAASQTAEEGVRIAAKIGAAYPEDIGAYLLGYIAQARGEYENAIAHYQHSLQAGRTSGIPFLEMLPLGALGSAYLDVSEAFLDRVAEYHTRAVQLMANPTSNSSAGMVWADMGFCILSRGDLDHAQEFFRKGLTVPTPQGLLNRPRFLIGSALVALARNQVDEAAGLVDEARTFAEERAMKHLYPLVALAEAQVHAARGDAQHALENFARAEALALELQMRPLVGLARVEAAKIMSALGRESDAEAKWQGARAMIEEIANLFEDAAMRALYVENASGKIMLQTSEVLKTWIVQPD